MHLPSFQTLLFSLFLLLFHYLLFSFLKKMKNHNAAGSSQRKRSETTTSSEHINKKKKTFEEVKTSDDTVDYQVSFERLRCIERQNEKIITKLNAVISKQKSLEEKFEETFEKLKELIINNNNNNGLDTVFIMVRLK